MSERQRRGSGNDDTGTGDAGSEKVFEQFRAFAVAAEFRREGHLHDHNDAGGEAVDLFFAHVMEDETVVATAENAEQLRALCDELNFTSFDDKIRGLLGGNWKVRRDLVGLRGRPDRQDVIIEDLQRRVLELER